MWFKRDNLIDFVFLGFIVTVPLVSIEFNVRILILCLFLSFFSKRFSFSYTKFFKDGWPILFYVSTLIFGICYSTETSLGLSVLETNFSFIALVLIFCRYNNISEQKFDIIFCFFVLGVFLACIICLVYAWFNYKASNDVGSFFFYRFTGVVGSHPTYLAYYIIFSITFLLFSFNKRTFLFRPFGFFAKSTLIFFLFAILILTGGRTAFVSLLLVCSFFLLRAILDSNILKRSHMVLLSSLMIVGMFLISSLTPVTKQDVVSNDASMERFQLWKSALGANPDPLFGVGTGDYKIILNKYYVDHGLTDYANENLNSHNQFLQIYLSNGVLGVIAVLFLIGRPIYLAIKNDHVFGVLVFFPFLIYGVTEVFLGRYQGVVFFALLHQIFVSYYLSQKPNFAINRLSQQ
jgi:O-antigen ligase